MDHLGGSIRNRPCTLGGPIRNRPCILGRPMRNRPCILEGTIQNSCLAKCSARISTNLSAHLSHLQTSSGHNFCQDAFGWGLCDALLYCQPSDLSTKTLHHYIHWSAQHFESFTYSAINSNGGNWPTIRDCRTLSRWSRQPALHWQTGLTPRH